MSERITAAEFRAKHGGKPQRSKYNNVPTEVDGIVFDSGREANRYVTLRDAEAKGQIRNLKLQYAYALVINGVYVTTYTADFQYDEKRNGRWVPVTEDAKGKRTEPYQMRKRLMKAVYGITIRET